MAKRYTTEDLKAMEELHNQGFSNAEIGKAIGRTEGSIGVQFAYKRKEMNLIDRQWARNLRKLREANTVAKIIEIQAKEPDVVVHQRQPEPKKSVWDRVIGFFG